MFVEDALAIATNDWTDPVVVRTYTSDETGRVMLPLEARVLAAYGYQPATQAAEGGHLNVGRLLATGGWSILFSASRTPGSATVTYARSSRGPLWDVDTSELGRSLAIIPTYVAARGARVVQIRRSTTWTGQTKVHVQSNPVEPGVRAAELELHVFQAREDRVYRQLRFADSELGELRFFGDPGLTLVESKVWQEQFGWSGVSETDVRVPPVEGLALTTVAVKRINRKDAGWSAGARVDETALIDALKLKVGTGQIRPGELKTCPMCAEDVKAAAVICRFCRFDFSADTGGADR